jgi:hypothetical protein
VQVIWQVEKEFVQASFKTLRMNTKFQFFISFLFVGEHGAGLYIFDSNIKKFVVVGIMSYQIIRRECAEPDLPA